MIQDKIIVALDTQDRSELDKLLTELSGTATYVKVGMELFYTFGNDIIKELKDKDFKIFLDLKMHDIPSTVYKACSSLSKLGVDMTNVHVAGGRTMMRAAHDGIKEYNEKGILIAVTQLTSTDQKTMNDQILIPGSVEDAVLKYASLTKDAGLSGVVCSPLEVELLKNNLGSDFKTVTPGIRPAGLSSNDQKRVMTPQEAIKAGTDYMVIGRAITQADSPKIAFENILKEIS